MTAAEANALLDALVTAHRMRALSLAWIVAHCPRGDELAAAWAVADDDCVMWAVLYELHRDLTRNRLLQSYFCANCFRSIDARKDRSCPGCAAALRAILPTIMLTARVLHG